MERSEYIRKRKEVLDRFGEPEEIEKMAAEDIHLARVVSYIVYGGSEYDMILDLIRIINAQHDQMKELVKKYVYPDIVKKNET